MIKIAVMSDNHGLDEHVSRVAHLENDALYLVHCGDSETFDDHLLRRFYAVRGNNDWMIDLKNNIIFEAGDHRILVTHGHRIGYFDRAEILATMAKENNCNIVLCGHTHMPMHEVVNGVHVINPGSTRLPRGGSDYTYCVLYLDGSDLKLEYKSIKDGHVLEDALNFRY